MDDRGKEKKGRENTNVRRGGGGHMLCLTREGKVGAYIFLKNAYWSLDGWGKGEKKRGVR